MTQGLVADINDAGFADQVTASPIPVIAVFGASWCAPCKAMMPAVNAFAEKNADRARVVKINVDKAPQRTREFAVRSLPTTMVFKGGKVQLTLIGSLTESQLSSMVEKHL